MIVKVMDLTFTAADINSWTPCIPAKQVDAMFPKDRSSVSVRELLAMWRRTEGMKRRFVFWIIWQLATERYGDWSQANDLDRYCDAHDAGELDCCDADCPEHNNLLAVLTRDIETWTVETRSIETDLLTYAARNFKVDCEPLEYEYLVDAERVSLEPVLVTCASLATALTWKRHYTEYGYAVVIKRREVKTWEDFD